MKNSRSKDRYKAPTVKEISTWTDEQLTNLSWAYSRVRFASGESKMMVTNWFNTLTKRVKAEREKRNINLSK